MVKVAANIFYGHLPKGMASVVSKKPPVITVINCRRCPNFNRPCEKKTAESPCCLGKENCQKECPNKGVTNEC